MIGILTTWKRDRAFGFLGLEDGREVFVHIRDLERFPHDPEPRVGDVVEFEVLETARGLRAVQARIVKPAEQT